MDSPAPIVASSCETKLSGGKVRISTVIDNQHELWFEVDNEFQGLLTENMDYLAVALLPVAMMEGRDLRLEGEITDTLLHQLNQLVQPLVRELYPNWIQTRVLARRNVPPPRRAAGAATGFSGGVDSFSALQTYFLDRSAPDSARVSYLLNNNVGSFHRAGGRAGWKASIQRLFPVIEELGLPLITVDSNLEDFYPQGMEFKYFHTFCNAAVAHFLSKGIGQLYYASAYDYHQILNRAGKPGVVAHLDPILLPLLSTSAVTLSSADPEKTRVMKTLALLKSPYRHYLDVCTSPDANRDRNCSRCEKCMRTQITLDIAGCLEEFFSRTFDRSTYLRYRDRHIAKILNDRDDLSREVVRFAQERGFRWPLRAQVGRFLVPFYYKIQAMKTARVDT